MTVTLVTALSIAALLLGLGGLMTEVGDWYRQLRKPPWNPPNWLFGPAWTVILGLAGWSGAEAWMQARDDGAHLRLGVLFGATAFLHLLWSPLFFKLKRPDLSLIEIPFLWLTILAAIVGVARISALAAWLLTPYLAWVAFATVLNRAIVRLNPPFGAEPWRTQRLPKPKGRRTDARRPKAMGEGTEDYNEKA
jgi:tryptophan-rich sensory protein